MGAVPRLKKIPGFLLTRPLKKKLAEFFDAKVQMTYSAKGKGKITIPFADEEELEHIMNTLDKMKK